MQEAKSKLGIVKVQEEALIEFSKHQKEMIAFQKQSTPTIDEFEKNRLKLVSYSRDYYEKNREKKLAYGREYHKKNRFTILVKTQKHYYQTIPQQRTRKQIYYEKNKDILNQKSMKTYYETKKNISRIKHTDINARVLRK